MNEKIKIVFKIKILFFLNENLIKFMDLKKPRKKILTFLTFFPIKKSYLNNLMPHHNNI
jgi:hypothetical protein